MVSSSREIANVNLNINFSKIIEYTIHFLKEQGVSFYVTAMAIEYYPEFKGNIINYILYGTIGAINSTFLNHSGRAFGVDLMQKINYAGYLQGYGTGSSFLAESYLLGGLFGVILISLFIGFILNLIYKYYSYFNIYIKIVSFVLFQYIIFLPRDLLLMPLSQIIKVMPYLFLIYLIFLFAKSIKYIERKNNENIIVIE